jgi:hypothetical protein
MQHRIAHGLDPELARKATRAALDSYRERFAAHDPGGEWTGPDRAVVWFQAAGVRLEGTVEVGPQEVVLDLEVPLIFRPLRKAALQVIEREVTEWIERARRGELR